MTPGNFHHVHLPAVPLGGNNRRK